MAPVFVTGGSGFIGGALIERLCERGDQPRGLARSATSRRRRSPRTAPRWSTATCCRRRSLAAGMEGCDLAFHVAGMNTHCPEDPDAMMRVNVEGTATAVRAAGRAGVKRLVYTSSASLGGRGPRHGRATRSTDPPRLLLSTYDRSKHEGEQAAFATGRELGVEVVAINPSSVQGPGRSSGNGKIAIDYVNGKLPVFVDTHVSVVDIADTVEGHLLAADHGRAGERYVLNGATITSSEALELVPGYQGSSSVSASSLGPVRQRRRRPSARGPTASGARSPRSAAPACGPSCTGTATTAPAPPASWGSSTRRWTRPSRACSSGRSRRAWWTASG